VPSRRKTREFVLQVLFAADAQGEDPLDAMRVMEAHFTSDDDSAVKMHRVHVDFAGKLIATVSRDKEEIDGLIANISTNWKLHRMTLVDRNVLRMAVAELTTFPEIPSTVTLNEAIDIGKMYGADNSAAFINGILDRIKSLGTRPSSAQDLNKLLTELDQLDSKG
jgi:transcription antitermination protein NusB